MKTDLEIRADAIAAKQREANETRYRELIFRYAAGQLTDDETVEIMGLADKLALAIADVDAHRTSIRQLQSEEREADTPHDFESLKAAVESSTKTARDAFKKFLVDFAGKLDSISSIGDAMSNFRKAFWSQATGDPLPGSFKSLIIAGEDAIRSLESAERKRPDALGRIEWLKSHNPLVWPKE
jgi:hypothetical protein